MLSVDGYVRVSRVGLRRGERFISPQIQRQAIESWASGPNVALLEVIEELDAPGRERKRPGLERAVARIEEGTSQGLVVWRMSRFGRSLMDGLATIERVREAGGIFFSVGDGLDTSTETGRLVLRIMLSMAEWELEVIRATWELARAKAVERGVYIGAYTPPGYVRAGAGRLKPDRRVSRVILEVFERRAAGEPLSSLGRHLQSRGILTAAGNPGWSIKTTASLLANRVYLGEVHSGEHVNTVAHVALVDETLWERAQHPRRTIVKPPRNPAVLTGLVVCGGCGMAMCHNGHHERGAGHSEYTCTRYHAGGDCPAPANIGGAVLEPCVEDVVFYLLHRRRRPAAAEATQAAERLRKAQAALASYRDDERLRGVLGRDRFAEGLAVRAGRVRDAAVALDAVHAKNAGHQLPDVTELERRWLDMTLHERRELIAKVIDCVIVRRATCREQRSDAEERIIVCPAGTGPRTSDPGPQATPLHSPRLRRTWISPSTTPVPRRWSDRRLARALEPVLAGRPSWPSRAEFHALGAGALHRAVLASGGDERWAIHFKLPIARAPRARWTDARIRTALSAYLTDKTSWPPREQFVADGKAELRDAVTAHGGVQYWADELGIARDSHNNGPRVHWTDDRIRNTLASVCADRCAFPSEATFTSWDWVACGGQCAVAVALTGGPTRCGSHARACIAARARAARRTLDRPERVEPDRRARDTNPVAETRREAVIHKYTQRFAHARNVG